MAVARPYRRGHARLPHTRPLERITTDDTPNRKGTAMAPSKGPHRKSPIANCRNCGTEMKLTKGQDTVDCPECGVTMMVVKPMNTDIVRIGKHTIL